MITCTKQLRHLLTALVLTLSALMPENAAAEKLLGLMCGKVYLSGGDVVELNDSYRIAMPVKKKQLCLVENAYSSRQKVSQRISPETVDSIVLWNATSPAHTHTLRYIPEFGWCWQLEKATGIAVYAFSPKGYHISGNGGMWTRGKSIMIVDRNGTLHRFSDHSKNANDKFRQQVADMVKDDPVLVSKIVSSRYRRDKTLRMLGLYNPAIL